MVEETGIEKYPSPLSPSGTSLPLTVEVGDWTSTSSTDITRSSSSSRPPWTQWDVRTGPTTSVARSKTRTSVARILSKLPQRRSVTRPLLIENKFSRHPIAASDNGGAFDKKQKNNCVIIKAAAGIPGRGAGQHKS